MQNSAQNADAIDDGLESGEVRADHKGAYQVDKQAINGAEVDRWRKLRAIPENVARRHLTTFQRAKFGEAWSEHERGAAKERQGKRNDIKETFPESEAGQIRDKIGERVGVSGKTIDKYRTPEPSPNARSAPRATSMSLRRSRTLQSR